MYIYIYIYLGLVEKGTVSLDGVRQPHLKALGKVTNGLCESAWDGPQYVRDEEVHNALVEEVVTGTDIVCDRLEAREKEELLFG